MVIRNMIRGIDVSENNGQVDWEKLQEMGVRFVYVRSSYGKFGRDEAFVANVDAAHAAGMLVGAYHYDYSTGVEDARLNAKNCRKAIDEAGVLLELPVFYDLEDADKWKKNHNVILTRETATEMCRAFGEELGLNWGVYASYSWLTNLIDWQSLGCPIWNAQWGDSDDIQGYVWQDTDNWQGLGIDGDYMYDEALFK